MRFDLDGYYATVQAGLHISAACTAAVAHANEHNQTVRFLFNQILVTARPGDDPKEVHARYANAMAGQITNAIIEA